MHHYARYISGHFSHVRMPRLLVNSGPSMVSFEHLSHSSSHIVAATFTSADVFFAAALLILQGLCRTSVSVAGGIQPRHMQARLVIVALAWSVHYTIWLTTRHRSSQNTHSQSNFIHLKCTMQLMWPQHSGCANLRMVQYALWLIRSHLLIL